MTVALLGNTKPPIVVLAPLFATAGAGCAAGSLVLARMAEDPEWLASGAEGESRP